MTEKPYEFGLLISRHFDVSNMLRITVSVVRHDDDYGKKPDGFCGMGVGSYSHQYPKAKAKMEFGEFEIHGQIYEGSEGREVIGFAPEFYGCYSVDLFKAERMVATLKAWSKLARKWNSDNPSERFTHVTAFNLLAKLTGAKWCVFRDYAADKNCWAKPVQRLSLAQGVYKYAQEVEKWKVDWVDPWKRRAS